MKQLIPTVGLILLLPLLLFGSALHAAPATQPRPAVSTRSDTSAAQLRFERAYEAHPPSDDAERARVHRAYDLATVTYFSGRHEEAIQMLNDLTDSLDHARKRPAHEALIRSLQVRVAPPVARSNRPSILRVRVAPMYHVPADAPLELRLRIRTDAPPQQSQTVLEEPVNIKPGGPPFTLARAQPDAPAGRYLVELVGPDGAVYPAGRWSVVEVPLDSIRLAADRSIGSLQGTNAEMFHAFATCRSRMMLLSDSRDDNNPAQYLADPVVLMNEVQAEVTVLTQGKNPYTGRPGDMWRSIVARGMEIPCRTYAPQQVQQQGIKPLPLVIALHDGGGDESTFMQFIGNARLKKLADLYGLMIVTPNVNWVTRNTSTLDAVIEAMSTIYPVDTSRVYLIGHGSGAVAAVNIAASQPDKVTKLVLFSGADFTNVTKLPPALLYAASLDPLFRPELARAAMRQAQAARLPVELREKKDAGHTLIVHDNLSEAIEWLLK